MAQFSPATIRTGIFAALLLAVVSQSGCAKSPSELLIGRWYSGDMTIRFREDSAVIWNSPRGLAKGRFEFSGKVRRVKTDDRVPNLFVDVIRHDEREKLRFEVSFLGKDRLRLDLIPVSAQSSATLLSQGIVLKRANDTTLGGAPTRIAQR